MVDGFRRSNELRKVGASGNLRFDHPQAWVGTHGPEIVQGPGGKIIYDRHGLPVRQQTLHQVRPDEASAAGYQNVVRDA